MKKIIGFILLFVSSLCTAQNENKIWYFGDHAGIDFNSGNAVALTNGSLFTYDNTSAISSPSGNLLFYTDGVTVWNSQHAIMSNGTGLLGHQSGGQAATIVPHPGNPNLYYIFTVDIFAGPNGLRYSIVDMSLQAGLGAVTTTKNVLMYTPASEKVLAVKHCNGRDYWLITHAWNSNTFKTYLIDINGLNTTPVQSSVGTVHTGGYNGVYNAAGQLSISPKGNRIGLTIFDMGVVEVLDFNNTTGAITNPITLNGWQQCWGTEFSPNGDYLYLTRWGGFDASLVTQFDLTAGNAAAVQASATTVGNTSGPDPSYKSGYLKLAPDGKIYIAKWHSTHLAVINNPDQPAVNCGFVDNGFSLGGSISQCGLCNVFVQRINLPTIQAQGICTAYNFTLSDTVGLIATQWNFGDPLSGPANNSSQISPTHIFTSTGLYTVQVIISYACFTDTITQQITVTGSTTTAAFTSPTFGCINSPVTFTNTSTNATTYYWNFGDTHTSTLQSPSNTYSSAGNYTVALIASNSCDTDTIVHSITISETPIATIISQDDTICVGQTITLTASGAPFAQWSGGSNANTQTITVSPTTTTAYYVVVSNALCYSTPDTIVIVVDQCLDVSQVPASTQSLLQIFPNPSSGNCSIQLPSNAAGDIAVFDFTGKLIYAQPTQTTLLTFDLSALANGVYLVRWTSHAGDNYQQTWTISK